MGISTKDGLSPVTGLSDIAGISNEGGLGKEFDPPFELLQENSDNLLLEDLGKINLE